MKKEMVRILSLLIFLMAGCGASKEKDFTSDFKYSYGVFLDANSSDISKMKDYQQIVIDVSYFTAEEIDEMHCAGQQIYAYLNVGSLEEFRDYYNQYSYLCLDAYENWEEEKWVDVSQKAWQEHVISLAKEYSSKGIDGFFVDNCDVYYNYPKPEIFAGLTYMLREIYNINSTVIINGGDVYITEYLDRYQTASDIMSGVNQECLFTSIDFSNASFKQSNEEDYEYFEKYIERCATDNMDVYLLEYSVDGELISQIQDYCEKNHYFYYISPSIELKATHSGLQIESCGGNAMNIKLVKLSYEYKDQLFEMLEEWKRDIGFNYRN